MTPTELQQWLDAHGQPVAIDGKPGAQTRAAIIAAFTNPCAPKVTDADVLAIASRLGCSTKQLRAVAAVESSGAAYDGQGRPKILFERHKFHLLTGGEYSPCGYSDRKQGGYGEDSWTKLTMAASRNADAAFSAASWGKFQIMGFHWSALGYPSPINMAYSTVTGEAASYDMLARYIEHFNIGSALRSLSLDPDANRSFARGFNGPAYEAGGYHMKLAKAMAA